MKCIYTRVIPLYFRHDVLQILYHWNYLFPPGGTVRVAISTLTKGKYKKKKKAPGNEQRDQGLQVLLISKDLKAKVLFLKF